MSQLINSHILTGTNLCSNKAINMLVMHSFLTSHILYTHSEAVIKIDIINSDMGEK